MDSFHCFDRIYRRRVTCPLEGGNRVQGGSLAKRGFKVNDRSILLKYVPSQLYNERKEGFQQAG